MALLSIREHGRIHLGEFDPARPSVSSAQADTLSTLGITYGVDVFNFVNRTTLAAQQFVGAVQLGLHTVEVLPKVDGDSKSVRRNLVLMLAVALDLNISEGEAARLARQEYGILEILIRLFSDKLFAQVHRGLVRRYECKEENLSVLRGKLGIAEQVRLNAANPERLFCRFDEFLEDNPLNQVFKAAIRLLLGVAQSLTNQRQLAELLLVFEGVSDCPRASLPWHRVVHDRLSDRYRPCFRLAELFLKDRPPDVSGGRAHGFSLFFDMNMLFEEYIGRIARRVLQPSGFRVTLQSPRKYLALSNELGTQVFAMLPDVVGTGSLGVEWILDTKWKQLSAEKSKDGVAQDDMYQMYAYAQRYSCPNVVLLYPHHQDLGETAGVRSTYLLAPWLGEAGHRDERRQVRVATIDLVLMAARNRGYSPRSVGSGFQSAGSSPDPVGRFGF